MSRHSPLLEDKPPLSCTGSAAVLGARERVAISDSGTLDSLAALVPLSGSKSLSSGTGVTARWAPSPAFQRHLMTSQAPCVMKSKQLAIQVGTEITGHGRHDQTIRKLLHQTTPRTNNQDLELTICLATASQRHYLKAFNQLQAQLTQRKCEGFRVHSAACQPQLLPLRWTCSQRPSPLAFPIANLYEADAPSSKRKACLAAVSGLHIQSKTSSNTARLVFQTRATCQKFVAEHAGRRHAVLSQKPLRHWLSIHSCSAKGHDRRVSS